MRGTLKHWNTRGFGFIARDDGHDDIFAHVSEFPEFRNQSRALPIAGTKVVFDIKPASNPSRPPVATNVRCLDTTEDELRAEDVFRKP
ncbi:MULTISPECIES: cold shock domain-containing protein [Rhodopseudomonas]|uniref:CSD domain-containing protein n=1 Tax=Rhodopseudomonas palustris TaxID=1076 RepID=A0A0D7EB27_RHOPL|nr:MULTISPECIES: cold shock domain-containing protein [Rhodopseudomonas]KIZ38064.1 hypothetical protein OO17_23130 [Rhodopseudomonas palustris]MDF3810541.1 cold shock domain-containing protein [Rhodopseudomonas sp. BAL398]WOK18399.1 cold shock domain-containing protein [Rhodopseudomonas sp. BAL398]